MTNNIHFHPNGNYATKFVSPLIEAEKSIGLKSLLVNSSNPANNTYSSIRYDPTANNLILLPVAFFKILRLILKTKPNSIISHNTTSSFLPLLSARLAKINNIIYFNHGVPHLGYSGLTAKALKIIESINCLLATEIITVSTDMSKELRKLTSKNITLINHGSACGVDLQDHSRKKHTNISFRKNLNINSKDTVFVYIGRPEERKGYNFLINLWANHFFNKINYRLLLCGINYKELKENLNEVPSNIIPLGFVQNIPEVLSNSDCLVLPSLHEGLSYAILEAMACECIVISNNIPGIRTLVKNQLSGYLLNTNDENEYVKKIKSLQRDGVSKELTKAALKEVKKYDRKKYMEDYIDFINNLGSLLRPSRPTIFFLATAEFAVNAFLLSHLKALSKSFDVTVIVNTDDPLFLTKQGVDVEVIPLSISRNILILSDVYCLIRLVYIFIKLRPSAVHSITPKAGFLAMLAAFIACVPFRVHTFTGQVWATSHGLKRVVLKFFDWLTARLATFNIIDSPSQQQFLINQKVLTKERSIVFGVGSVSGVDLKRFKPSKKVLTEVRHELGIPEDAFVFIYLGRLNKDKGILDLARAFTSLKNKNTCLLVVGPDEGDFVEEMKRLCGGSVDRLRFVAYTRTPERFLAASNVLCLPSYREGFGSVVIEAAAIGLPAIASNIYGISDAIVEKKNGLASPTW